MQEEFSRTQMLIGYDALEKLRNSRVAVFGVGGVGSYAAEALARCGVGSLVLIDHDVIVLSNINRQLHALHSTLGRSKVDVTRERILDINPKAQVLTHKMFYTPDNAEQLLSNDYDYIVDAIDTVTAKLDLIVRAQQMGIPIISSMGAGNKLNPAAFIVADIYDTSVCPLCRVVRTQLKKRGIKALKVVYSKEPPIKPMVSDGAENAASRKQTPGSISFVPSAAGLIIAGEVIKDLIAGKK